MKRILHTEKGLKRAQIWFNEKADLKDVEAGGVDLLEFRESLKPLDIRFKPFRNGVVNLDRKQEKIFEGLTKGFKYEVRRAQKEGISTAAAYPPEADVLERCYGDYLSFSRNKSLTVIAADALRRYRIQGNLAITWACLSADARPLQYHVYFTDEKEAILLASFPAAGREDVENKFFGFANRLLHWEDMVLFKSKGFSRYNLGGVGNPGSASNENIMKFKLEMSPMVEEYFQAIVPVSWKAKLYWFLRARIKGEA